MDVVWMAFWITLVPLVFVTSHYVLGILTTTELNDEGHIDEGQDALEVYNNMFPFMYFSFGIIAVILAVQTSVNPVFAGISLLLYGLLGIFVAQISNVYQVVEDSGAFATSFSAFSNVGLLHDNLVIISLGFLFIIGIAMVSKGGVRISE